MEFTEEIKQTILQEIPDAEVLLHDPMNDGIHLEAIVISPSFKELSLVKQHRMVMRALEEHFENQLHALRLKTYTPEKWEETE